MSTFWTRTPVGTFSCTEVKFRMHNCVSDVQVHTDFPTLPVQTTLETRIAPMDTGLFSVGETAYPLPGPVKTMP